MEVWEVEEQETPGLSPWVLGGGAGARKLAHSGAASALGICIACFLELGPLLTCVWLLFPACPSGPGGGAP